MLTTIPLYWFMVPIAAFLALIIARLLVFS